MGRAFFRKHHSFAPSDNTEKLSKNVFFINNVSNHFELNFLTSNIKIRHQVLNIDLNHFIQYTLLFCQIEPQKNYTRINKHKSQNLKKQHARINLIRWLTPSGPLLLMIAI